MLSHVAALNWEANAFSVLQVWSIELDNMGIPCEGFSLVTKEDYQIALQSIELLMRTHNLAPETHLIANAYIELWNLFDRNPYRIQEVYLDLIRNLLDYLESNKRTKITMVQIKNSLSTILSNN